MLFSVALRVQNLCNVCAFMANPRILRFRPLASASRAAYPSHTAIIVIVAVIIITIAAALHKKPLAYLDHLTHTALVH